MAFPSSCGFGLSWSRFGYRADSLRCLKALRAPVFEAGHQRGKAAGARAGSPPAHLLPPQYPHTRDVPAAFSQLGGRH